MENGDQLWLADKEVVYQIIQRDLFTDVHIQEGSDVVCQIIVLAVCLQLSFRLKILQHLVDNDTTSGISCFKIQRRITQYSVHVTDMLLRLCKGMDVIRKIHVVRLTERASQCSAAVDIDLLVRIVKVRVIIQMRIGTYHIEVAGMHQMFHIVYLNVAFAAQYVFKNMGCTRMTWDEILIIRKGFACQFYGESSSVTHISRIKYNFVLNIRLGTVY